MTAVLQTWCNEILHLSHPVQNVEADFANGYLFGEILYKHNQIDNNLFSQFTNKLTATTILKNFTILEEVFHRIGIKLNARTVAAIIHQKPQTAQRILYELKTKLTIFERVVVGYTNQTANEGIQDHIPPPSSSSAASSSDNNGPSNDEYKKVLARLQLKTPKPSYEIASQQIFSKAVRTLGGNQRAKDMAKFLSVFTNDKFQEYIQQIDDYNQAVVQATRNYYDQFRHNRRLRMASQVNHERKLMEKGAQEWAKNQTIRISTERQQRYIAARLNAEKVERKRALNNAAAEDYDLGTNEFTHITAVQGYDIQPNRSNLETQRIGQAPPSTTLRRDEFVAELNSRLGDPEGAPETLYRESKHASNAILHRLQNRSQAEQEADNIRRRRRAAVLSSIETGLERNLGNARLESLKSAVMAPSVPEVALMTAVSSVLRAERAFITRRAELESQIENQAKATNWAELERQRNIFHDLRAEHDRAVELALFTYDRAASARAAAETSAAADLANTLLRKVLDFAIEVSRQREIRRGIPTPVGKSIANLRKQRQEKFPHTVNTTDSNQEEKKGDSDTFVDINAEFDDGQQYEETGIYDLPASIYRDLQIVFSSRYPMPTAIPDINKRPLANLTVTDVNTLANTLNPPPINPNPEVHAPSTTHAHDKDHRPSTGNRRASVTAQNTPPVVDNTLVQRQEEQQKVIHSYLNEETAASLALLPIAGNRGNIQDDEISAQIRTLQSVHGNNAIDAKSFSLLLEGTQALLDACSLRDYLVNIGAWARPDIRSANITQEVLDDIETVILKMCRDNSNNYKGGITSLFPEYFNTSIPAVPKPAPEPTEIKPPARRASVVAATPEVLPPTEVAPASTHSSKPFGIEDLPVTPGTTYTSEREVKIAQVLQEQIAHPLLGSRYLHYALLQDSSLASDVFGHVIRNITTAADSIMKPNNTVNENPTQYPYRFPLTVALVGPPHTGKLTQAIRLGEMFRLAVIHPKALIGRGIALAWPSSKARAKALNDENSSRPSSRASIGSPLNSTVNSSIMDNNGIITNATITSNNNRRPNSAGRSRTPPRIIPPFGLDGVQPKSDDNNTSTENAFLLVDGQVVRTSEAPTSVPPVLSPVLPVDSHFLTPFFDAQLRAVGSEILNSSAVIPMDGGMYRSLPPGVGPGTVDAHIDWNKIPESYFFNMIISAIEYLARSPDSITGWLLVDFPNNLEQAAKLEEKLTGWQAPPDVSGNYSGDGLRSPVPLAKADEIRITANDILASAIPSSGSKNNTSSPLDQIIYSSLNDAKLGTAAAVKDDEDYWSSLMAPVPDPVGIPIAPQKFDITWPHGIDIVLRIDTTPDRILRRALGWKVDLTTLTTATSWDNINRDTSSSGSVAKSTSNMIESTPDCPIAAILTSELGIDLPAQIHIAGSPVAKDLHVTAVNNSHHVHLPSVYHTDAVPPQFLCETVDNFIPIAASDLAYRPGADGSRVVTTGVDIGELGSVIASATEKWDAAVPGLDSWYNRGNNLHIIRNWTKRKGPLRFRNNISNSSAINNNNNNPEPSFLNNDFSGLNSGAVSAVDDIGPGGESIPNQPLATYPSNSIPTIEDNLYSNENTNLDDNGGIYPRSSNNTLSSGGIYGIYSESKEEIYEELDDDEEDNSREGLDGDSIVLEGNRNNNNRNTNAVPDHSGAVATSGQWNPVRFDLINENELFMRLRNALQAGIHAKEASEIARKEAKEAMEAAVQAQITNAIQKRERANRLRTGADVALNELLVKVGEEAAVVIEHRKAAEQAALLAQQEREAKEAEEGETELPPMEPIKLDTSPLPTIPTVDTDVLTIPKFTELVGIDAVTNRIVPPPLPPSVTNVLTPSIEPEPVPSSTSVKVKFTDERALNAITAPKLPENIPVSLPIVLSKHWKACVNKYSSIFKINTRSLRTIETVAVSRLSLVRRRVQAYLIRPCPELNLPLAHFQRHWNDIGLLGATKALSTNTLGVLAEAENIVRLNSDGENDIVRTEARMRLEEALAIMWDGVDNREAEALTRLAALRDDNWIQHVQSMVINTYAQLLQAEAERFTTTRSILCDYYTGAEGAIISDFLCTSAQDAVDRALQGVSNETTALLDHKHTTGVRRASISKEPTGTHSKPASKPSSASKEKPTAGKPPVKGGKGEPEPEHVHEEIPPKDPLLIDENILRTGADGTDINNLLIDALITFATEFAITIPTSAPVFTVNSNAPVATTTEATDPKRAASAGKKATATPAPTTTAPKPGAAPAKAPAKNPKEEAAEKAAAEHAAAEKAALEAALEAERARNPEPTLPAAKAIFGPLKRFIVAVRKAMAIADAATGATESIAVSQVLAREKRIASERAYLQAAVTKQRTAEAEATANALAAAAAAVAAAEQAANPKDAKAKPGTTSSKPSRPASGSKDKNAPAPTTTTPAPVPTNVTVDVPPPKPTDEIILQTVLPPSPAATLIDEGFFLSIRYETNNYRNRILSLLRHAIVHITRITAQGDACYQNIYSDILRTSLAEGATIEAFGELARQAINHGTPLPNELRIEYNADCVAFLVDKSIQAYKDTKPNETNNGIPALPNHATILERGDMLADIDQDTKENNNDKQDNEILIQRFISCLTPSQIAHVAQAIKDAAITYTADAAGPFGTNGVIPPSALPSHVFIDTLIRLGASGSLPTVWTEATLQAATYIPHTSTKDTITISPFHALAEKFLITEAAEGTAAAAAMKSGDLLGSAIDDVVDWRLFILSLCFTGPAEDVPGPLSLALNTIVQPPNTSSHQIIVAPTTLGISTGIAFPPSLQQISELYTFTTQYVDTENNSNNDDGFTNENKQTEQHTNIVNFESVLIPRSILQTIPLWFEGNDNITNTTLTNENTKYSPSSSRSNSPTKDNNSVSVLQAVQSTLSNEYSTVINNTKEIGNNSIIHSIITGNMVIKQVIYDTFSMPAGAVLNDPRELTLQGLDASDELIDLGIFCNTLTKLTK